MDLIGQRLGNYQLVRLLGEGGYAQVYLGQHELLDMQAAIKVVQNRFSERDIDRFLHEARAVAHLHHTHIVRVLECAVAEGRPYLVMEYAPGGSLRQRHPDGIPLMLTMVERYVQQISQALQYAHDQQVIHRDVKPENLLVGAQGQLLLADFGFALLTQQSSSRLPMQDVGGTVAYMAPEQVQGHPRRASDQYALGVMVYEWLTGTSPFSGSVAEIITQHLSVIPRSPRELAPGITRPVEQVVLRALAKDPKARFPSVQAFADAFAEACQALEGASRTPRPVSRSVPAMGCAQQAAMLPAAQPAQRKRVAFQWARSHRWLLSVGLAVLLPVLALGSGLLWQFNSFQQTVVTGQYVTRLQVGVGLDPKTGAIQGVGDTFFLGKTLALFCTIVGWNGVAEARLYLGTTLVASQQGQRFEMSDDQAGAFTASATPLHPGRYRWEVFLMSFGAGSVGRPDASITFQVTDWLPNLGLTRLVADAGG